MKRNTVPDILRLINPVYVHQVTDQMQNMPAQCQNILQVTVPLLFFTRLHSQFSTVDNITEWSPYIMRYGKDNILAHLQQSLILFNYPLLFFPLFFSGYNIFLNYQI